MGLFWGASPILTHAKNLFSASTDVREKAAKGLRDAHPKTRKEAEGLLRLIEEQGANDSSEKDAAFYAILITFQSSQEEAAEVLLEKGPTILNALARRSDPGGQAWAIAVKLLGMMGTPESVTFWRDRFLDVPDPKYWALIPMLEKPPCPELLFPALLQALDCPKKSGYVLAIANAACLSGGLTEHPLRDRLSFLASALDAPPLEDEEEDAERQEIQRAACTALAFISGPEARQALEPLLSSVNTDLRMEAAYALARKGDESGILSLANACMSPLTLFKADTYLKELHLEHRRPQASRNDDLQAMAEFAYWLSHPNELARLPDSVEIVDQRTLRWPPDFGERRMRLIRYRVRDSEGKEDSAVGLVGSTTFCLFGTKLDERPPEDGYALHLAWELTNHNLLVEDREAGTSTDYDPLLKSWTGSPLRNPKIAAAMEIAESLNYGAKIVAAASAVSNGEQGWAVFDGSRSRWYPQSQMPSETTPRQVLSIHLGWTLLGFETCADRKSLLKPPPIPPTPEEIIAAFRQRWGKTMALAPERRRKQLDLYRPIFNKFREYASALASSNRGQELRPILEVVEPVWSEHPSGWSHLGNAAFQCRLDDVAMKYLTRTCDGSSRGEEPSMLAELLVRNGKPDEARDRLLRALRETIKESRTAKGSDRQLFERWFQGQRQAFLRLFPALGETHLRSQEIPASTLGGC